MQDCIVPPPFVKYGDQIYIKYENQHASVNQQSIFEIGATKNMVFISSTNYNLYSTPLKYGDTIIIVAPSKAAYVNSTTSMLSIGPVGDMIQQFMVFPPTGSTFEHRAKIRYGDPFVLVSISKVNWSKQQSIDYMSNDIGHSIKSLSECQAECAETPGCAGIVTDRSGRNDCWMKTKFASAIESGDRNTFMLDPAANTSVNTTSINWEQISSRDYRGNDINSSNKSIDQCKASCQATSGCAGIVTNDAGTQCWLKKKFGSGNKASNRNTYIMNVSTVNLPPFKKSVMDKYSVGYVNNNIIMFGPEKNSMGKNIFTFESATNPPYVAECNLNDLKNQCQRDSNCNGIIHSEKDKTWQMMNNKTTYKLTPSPPNIYVKDIAVNGNNATFIDSNTFSNYPVNNNFVKEGSQEYNIDNKNLLKKKQEYNQRNNMAFQEGDRMLNTMPDIPPYINETKNMYTELNSKTNEYKTVLKSIKKEKEKYNGTFKQQTEDLNVLQKSNNQHAYLWGFSSIIVISMVVILKNKQ
jgi:hypothetical protein